MLGPSDGAGTTTPSIKPNLSKCQSSSACATALSSSASASVLYCTVGIRGVALSEEDRNVLVEQGLDPDTIDYAGTDLEVLVTNRDTLRRQWEEIMNVCVKDRSGSLPGKTIIFAMTKEHGNRIREVFEEMFPQYAGLLQVIYTGVERVHDGPYRDGLISKFKKEDKPRFAVSVDMLDTGIDVPEVVNLVFMKPVHSRKSSGR